MAVLLVSPAFAGSKKPENYSKRIVGRWLGPRKFIVFHANGTWGIQRNEEEPEQIDGRRWRIEGDQFFLTYPGDHGLETTACTIASFTRHKFVTIIDGYRQEYEWWP